MTVQLRSPTFPVGLKMHKRVSIIESHASTICNVKRSEEFGATVVTEFTWGIFHNCTSVQVREWLSQIHAELECKQWIGIQ
jgi:hypothetical protein